MEFIFEHDEKWWPLRVGETAQKLRALTALVEDSLGFGSQCSQPSIIPVPGDPMPLLASAGNAWMWCISFSTGRHTVFSAPFFFFFFLKRLSFLQCVFSLALSKARWLTVFKQMSGSLVSSFGQFVYSMAVSDWFYHCDTFRVYDSPKNNTLDSNSMQTQRVFYSAEVPHAGGPHYWDRGTSKRAHRLTLKYIGVLG